MFERQDRCNQEIRKTIKKLGLRQCDVAKLFVIQESMLSKALRYELTDIEKKAFLKKLKEVEGE